ncbi:hypothetical protein GYB22_04235 [bacterium]|nr:hypothetical protein [bacterium]
MKNYIYTLIFIFTGAGTAFAQGDFKTNHDFSLALSAGSSEFNGAIAWKQVYGIGKNKKFKLGYGLRYNVYGSGAKDYTTAPAELTSKMTGPGVFFSETYPENIDTISMPGSIHNSLNTTIYIEYDFNDKWGIGFNIDAFGLSFGPERTGTVTSSSAPPNADLNATASPTPFNVLLISDNDIGMLNSELYGTYNFNEKMGIRLGFTFLFTEYTTNQPLEYNFDNDRFRHKSLMGMVSFNYRPFK